MKAVPAFVNVLDDSAVSSKEVTELWFGRTVSCTIASENSAKGPKDPRSIRAGGLVVLRIDEYHGQQKFLNDISRENILNPATEQFHYRLYLRYVHNV